MTSSNDRNLIDTFYATLLNHGGSTNLVADAERFLAPDWQSIGNYTGQNKDRTMFAKQMTGILQVVPDLRFHIEEVISAGDRYVVRSRASGTPRDVFFGVPPSGKRFEVMTIDIHTVRDGKIVTTHHVEDWLGALGQLKA